jgi:hypothetical protein
VYYFFFFKKKEKKKTEKQIKILQESSYDVNEFLSLAMPLNSH